MLRTIIFFFASVFAFSCANMAENNLDEIADDYCKCFATEEKNLSKNSKNFFKLIAQGETDAEVLAEERNKLSEEEQAEVQDLAMMMQNTKSKLGKCIARVDKKVGKYKTKDQDGFYDKLIDEMESRKNCRIMSYILTAGKKELAKRKKNNDSEEETEEETE